MELHAVSRGPAKVSSGVLDVPTLSVHVESRSVLLKEE